jgi:hypothetical protein
MINKSTYQTSNSRDRGKQKFTIGGGIVVLLIAISPYLLIIYENFPVSQTWKIFGFEVTTHYQSFQHFIWFLTSKTVPLYLLLIWFFTCKHWWHWIILIPIAMYLFQTWGIINQNLNADEVEIFYMIPLMMIIVPMVYLIRAKVFNKMRGDNLREFEEELKQKKTIWGELKDLFR